MIAHSIINRSHQNIILYSVITVISAYFYVELILVPTFKAGMHTGNVIAGEIGIFKRDITYSGDVMNTTSRMRSMCKELNAELIASSDLLKHLSFTNQFNVGELGSIELRGKKKKIELSSLTIGSKTPSPPVSGTPRRTAA